LRSAARLAPLLGLLLLGIYPNQAISRGFIYANANGAGSALYTWSGSAPSWNGSIVAASISDFTTYVRNNGSCGTPSGALITYAQSTTCAVNSITHSPILTNNTFTGGSFVSWSSSNTGACGGNPFVGQNTSDEDNDNGYALASSLGCTSTAAVITLVQTFTISGTPTSQTYSFWYKAAQSSFGDPTNCTQGYGGASLALKVNSTIIATPSLTLDGAWHQISGMTTALVNGSNSLTVTATLSAASGQSSTYIPKYGIYRCVSGSAAQPIAVDNVVLGAAY
jgi:hypothetical protein